jgi:hypothetical protein
MAETQRHKFALPASDVAKLEGKVCKTKSEIAVLRELPSFEYAVKLSQESLVSLPQIARVLLRKYYPRRRQWSIAQW